MEFHKLINIIQLCQKKKKKKDVQVEILLTENKTNTISVYIQVIDQKNSLELIRACPFKCDYLFIFKRKWKVKGKISSKMELHGYIKSPTS